MIFVFVLTLALAAAQTDPCGVHPDCSTCVHDVTNVCGWCSTDVVYEDGLHGGHCASNNGNFSFVCPAVYSTEDCQPGWKCNKQQKKCHTTPPGTGFNKYQCFAQCGELPPAPPGPPGGPTYICNARNYTCEKPPPGLHGYSKATCEVLCKPSPPATPSTPTPKAKVYTCDKSTWQCKIAKPGATGASSFEVCKGGCFLQKNYTCDFQHYKCVETKDGSGVHLSNCEASCVKLYHCETRGVNYNCKLSPFPSPGVPIANCKEHCKPSNSTPSDLNGLWRGLQINIGYAVGEWDVQFMKGMVHLVGPNGLMLMGNTTFLGSATRRVVRITVRKSTLKTYNVNSFLEIWYQYDGTSPETRFLMMAAGPENEYSPSTWSNAVNSKGGMTFTMTACQPLTTCKFHLRPASSFSKINQLSIMDDSQQVNAVTTFLGKVHDPCSKLTSCAICLAHARCGWCSVPVTYKYGQKGGNCAGLATSTNGQRIQFRCPGTYRTDNCNDYECVLPQGQCVRVPLGAGTNHSDCMQHCHRGGDSPSSSFPPPQAPAVPTLWYCNETMNQCMPAYPGQAGASSQFICENICGAPPVVPAVPSAPVAPQAPARIDPVYICNSDFQCQRAEPGTKGATSQLLCESTCVTPPPPPSGLYGTYRGIQTDNQYKVGEFEFTLNTNAFTMTLNGAPYANGTITTSKTAGALMIRSLHPIHEINAAIYSINVGVEVEHLTLVISPNTDAPRTWDKPFILGGQDGREFVFIKASKKH